MRLHPMFVAYMVTKIHTTMVKKVLGFDIPLPDQELMFLIGLYLGQDAEARVLVEDKIRESGERVLFAWQHYHDTVLVINERKNSPLDVTSFLKGLDPGT